MFSLISVWINGWVNNREAGDLRRRRSHYDVIVMVLGRCLVRHRPDAQVLWYVSPPTNTTNDTWMIIFYSTTNTKLRQTMRVVYDYLTDWPIVARYVKYNLVNTLVHMDLFNWNWIRMLTLFRHLHLFFPNEIIYHFLFCHEYETVTIKACGLRLFNWSTDCGAICQNMT